MGITPTVIRKVTVPVLLLVLWLIITHFELVRPIFIPGPQHIWIALKGLLRPLPAAMLTTVTMTLSGFIIGTVFGTVSGLLMAYSRVIRDLLGAIFDFLRPVPIFALIPLFLLWFGIGRAPQVALIALGTSVVLGVTTIEAIRNVPPIYVRAALTLGANRSQIYRTVIVPYILPHLVGAIRVAAASSWGLDVAAEFMGSQQGLGYLIIQQQIYLRTAGIMVLAGIYSLLAVGLDWIIARVEAKIMGWTERHSAVGVAATIVGGGR